MSTEPLGVGQRRRIRLNDMAHELDISERQMRKFLTLGMPHTRLMGVLWFEPSEVHRWLDKFNRRGTPGVKRTQGIKVAEVNASRAGGPKKTELVSS